MWIAYKWIAMIIGTIIILAAIILLLYKCWLWLSTTVLFYVRRTYVAQWFERFVMWPKVEKKLAAMQGDERADTLKRMQSWVANNVRMKTCKYQSYYFERLTALINN